MIYGTLSFAVYDVASGVIAQINLAESLESVLTICGSTQSAVPVATDVRDDSHYISAKTAVPYPAKTFGGAVWNGAAWADLRTLAQVKAQQWAKIKVYRTAAIVAPLNTPVGVVDATDESQFNIVKRILMLNNTPAVNLPATLKFTLADNTDATVTPTQMVQIGLLLGQQVEAAFTRGRLARNAIAVATTAADVIAVVW